MLKETHVASAKKIASAPSLFRFLSILIIIFSIFGYIYSSTSSSEPCVGKRLRSNKLSFCAKVADDSAERMLGLSGVRDLGQGEAMLFIFDKDSRYGIWMKDMLMPLDIVWLSSNKRIVHIEKNVNPDSYPKIFYPESNSRYVIELGAGTVDKAGLGIDYLFEW